MEVFRGGKLTGSVALEAQHCVVRIHSAAVVYHLDEGAAGIGDNHLHVRCARIYRILHQLLNHRGWSLDHFPGSYHIGNIFG